MPWETAAPARRLLADMRGGVRFGRAGGEAAKGHVKGCARSFEGPELEPTMQKYSTAQVCSAIQQRRPSELQNAALQHTCPNMEAWQTWKVSQLLVLPSSTFEADRICVMWTCPGMLRHAQALQEKVVKLALDAKQKVVANECGIVTLSFLVSSAVPSKTWAGATHTKSTSAHTATQEPFLQALVDTESEANMTQIFTEACKLAEGHCGLDLRGQIWQVDKDYAKGIEASRRKVFPYARPCDDYAHMRRATCKGMQKCLPAKKTLKVKAPKPQFVTQARASKTNRLVLLQL